MSNERDSIKVNFLGDTDHLARAAKAATGHLASVERSAQGLGSKLAGVGKAAAFGIAGGAAVAVGGLTAALANGVRDAMSYEKVTAITNAAIKSTGGVANVSAKSVKALAGDLESLSGVDEELIVNAQNVLLTFTKVRNETGKGNDVFNQGTKAALNMSIALKQDLRSASTLVGKALNDPLKGITALTRSGVQFTDQQKKQIRTMVEAGDTIGAQKVILGELETQFGGVAKAAGSGLEGSIARAKDAFSDLFRNIATPLLPKIAEWAEGFAVKVNEDVAPALLSFIDGFEKGTGAGGDFRDGLEDVMGAARDAAPHVKALFDNTKDAVEFVVDHKDAFAPLAAGVAAYATAMKAAAIWSAAMALNGPKAAAGIAATGAAAGAAGGAAGARGVGAKAGLGGLIGTAILELDGLLPKSLQMGSDPARLPLAPKSTPRPTSTTPRPGGSSQDRLSPVNEPTKVFPRNGQVAGLRTGSETVIHTHVHLDGRQIAEVVNRENARSNQGGF